MTRSIPTRLVTCPHDAESSQAKLTENGLPAGKDSCLLADAYDLTPARVAALTRAVLGGDTNKENAVEMGIRAICPEHHQTRRAEAIADLVRCSEPTGKRISKHATGHAETWPLHLAGLWQFLTFDGAVALARALTGMDEPEAETLIRRCIGPEIQK